MRGGEGFVYSMCIILFQVPAQHNFFSKEVFCTSYGEVEPVAIATYMHLYPGTSYGKELSSLFRVEEQKAPTVVLKCIEAVEKKGMHCILRVCVSMV